MVTWFIIWVCLLGEIAIGKADWAIFIAVMAIFNELLDIEKELKKWTKNVNEKREEVFEFPAEMVAEVENEARADELEAAAPTDDLLGLTEFQEAFANLFGVAAAMTGLSPLLFRTVNASGATRLLKKVYNLLATSPTLRRWFLANGGAMFGDWLIVATFVGRKALDVTAEVRGVERKDVLTAAGEKIGRGFLRGVLGKLKFWGKQ